MEPIWLAFICGILIGVILGGLSMVLFTLKQMEKKNDLIRTIYKELQDN